MAIGVPKPRVLIVGAGIGGLTLAQCLRKQGIPFEIFERDTDAHSRFLGWAIGIHGILDDLIASIPDDLPPIKEGISHLFPLNLEAQISLYIHGKHTAVQSTPEKPIIRANRPRLRDWLSTHIPIQWGKRPIWIEQVQDKILLHFEDGTTATGDILVGADGINSFVREHLLRVPNKETIRLVPSCMIIGETTLSGEAFERQLSMAHSCYMASGPASSNYFLFVGLNQVSPDGKSGRYYWFTAETDESISNEDHWAKSASKADLYDHVVKLTSNLESRFSEVIRSTSASEVRDKPFIIRDAEIEHLPVGRITLLGDAAHPMGPYRGEGGVHAFRDALNLSKAIGQLKSNDTSEIESLFRPYQKEMLERGVRAVKASRGQHSYKGVTTSNQIIAWGQTPVEVPDEIITLEACLP